MLKAFNDLMDFVELHLTEAFSEEDLARVTGLSSYHFRRMFSYLTGMSLTDYVRKRRLSMASRDLAEGKSVTEVAFDYGYGSVEGFSRAFTAFSGILPSEVQKLKQQIAFPKLNFSIEVKGGFSMEFRIERKDAFKLVGRAARVPLQATGVNADIVALAQSITPEQRVKMRELADLAPAQPLNVSYDFDEAAGTLMHMIGFATTAENPHDDLVQLDVAASDWAIFPCCGAFPQVFQETWAQIFGQWLPSSDYELVDLPQISFTDYSGEAEEKYSEIWLAVKKK